MREHHRYQQQLGVSDPTLELLIDEAQQQPGIAGAKISGSGLGDCIVTLGHLTQSQHGTLIPITLSDTGILHD